MQAKDTLINRLPFTFSYAVFLLRIAIEKVVKLHIYYDVFC